MAETLRVARKEFAGFFASPAAFLFLGAFLLVSLFLFFWVETFFARNLADLRPLFQWMPLLLIFLVAALTMRAWSEERRAGTLEALLTNPVPPLVLVLGKFLAALALVGVALALTLPLPLIVAVLGPLDWGPVIGGYLAALFLAAAYIAMGLYLSARTDNPIVALILTALVGGAFWLVGSDGVTALVGHGPGELLRLLGSGSRFESITRGVLDLRDLVYYLSLTGLFLTLNLHALERLRWAGNPPSARHRRAAWTAGLAAANFVALNLWLAPVGWLRADITDGRIHSLSDATRGYLEQVREPLLIRGYFSAKTHPLLAPLVPQLRDLLEEYAVAGGERVRVELVDPHDDPALEEEAASRYGIRPVPFESASKYQASVVSSYFDILVAYGDQYQTLNYRDLIEVKARGERDLDVALKNPEYLVTGAVRKVMSAYRAGGNPFEGLTRPVTFAGYLSPKALLPEPLDALRDELDAVLGELRERAGGTLEVRIQDPEAGDGALARDLEARYGFGPQVASLLDPRPFWFYLVLEGEGGAVQVPLPPELDREGLERAIEAGLMRLAPGYLRTVALVTPHPGYGGAGGTRYTLLKEALAEDVRIVETELADGQAPPEADLLMLLAPEGLSEKQVFALDQFLMQGGSLVIATSPFDVEVAGSLDARRHGSGLEGWLKHLGIAIGDALVLDPLNAALPVPVERYLGPIPVQEIRMLPYPHFPDLRDEGLSAESPITADLGQLTLNWASPVELDPSKIQGLKVDRLLNSSPRSWTSAETNVLPDYRRFPDTGFEPGERTGESLLAVALEGRFESFFKGKPSPLAQAEEQEPAPAEGGEPAEAKAQPRVTGVIERSPDSARVILVASNTFASDAVLELASQGLGTLYTRPVEFLQNAVDWSLDDRGLLGIRGRARFARTLAPLERGDQLFWEYLSYGLAVAGLSGLWLGRRRARHAAQARHQALLAEV